VVYQWWGLCQWQPASHGDAGANPRAPGPGERPRTAANPCQCQWAKLPYANRDLLRRRGRVEADAGWDYPR
jgi:hypothetical protein